MTGDDNSPLRTTITLVGCKPAYEALAYAATNGSGIEIETPGANGKA
jgi:hypothetical protein